MPYFTYIVQCRDATLYCGYTTDLKKRVIEHNTSKKGAKYTKARRPVVLQYFETFTTVSKALKREHEIKKLTREKKLALITKKKK